MEGGKYNSKKLITKGEVQLCLIACLFSRLYKAQTGFICLLGDACFEMTLEGGTGQVISSLTSWVSLIYSRTDELMELISFIAFFLGLLSSFSLFV